MVARVVAMPPAQFKQWLLDKRRDIEAADKDAQTRRSQEAKDTAQGESPVPNAQRDLIGK
jgi:hypothetical protein